MKNRSLSIVLFSIFAIVTVLACNLVASPTAVPTAVASLLPSALPTMTSAPTATPVPPTFTATVTASPTLDIDCTKEVIDSKIAGVISNLKFQTAYAEKNLSGYCEAILVTQIEARDIFLNDFEPRLSTIFDPMSAGSNAFYSYSYITNCKQQDCERRWMKDTWPEHDIAVAIAVNLVYPEAEDLFLANRLPGDPSWVPAEFDETLCTVSAVQAQFEANVEAGKFVVTSAFVDPEYMNACNFSFTISSLTEIPQTDWVSKKYDEKIRALVPGGVNTFFIMQGSSNSYSGSTELKGNLAIVGGVINCRTDDLSNIFMSPYSTLQMTRATNVAVNRTASASTSIPSITPTAITTPTP